MKVGLVMAAAFIGAAAGPAKATTYTDDAAFIAASGAIPHNFPNEGEGVPVGPSYTRAGATFSGAQLLLFDDGAFGPPPGPYPHPGYLGDDLFGQVSDDTLTVSTTGKHALGFALGSYYGAATYDYSVNGVSGSINVPTHDFVDTGVFIGFTDNGPITVTFDVPAGSELDVTSVYTAGPEPETWAMMLAGIGAIGAVGRARRRRERMAAATA